MAEMISRRLRKAARTALLLRCPRCGRGKLFRGMFAMHERCLVCDLVFEREPGYFVGAIYVNYAMTAALTISGFLLLDSYTTVSLTAQIVLWSVFGIAFPLGFFRYSKSIWLAVDHFFSPDEPSLGLARKRIV